MNIIELLKSDKCAAVISDHPHWMYWDSETEKWIVKREDAKGKRVTLYSGKSESRACAALFKASKI